MNRQYSALSGVAIVLIAINHAIHFGFEVAAVDGLARSALIVLQAMGVFAVPAFLFISGAFLSYSAARLTRQFIQSNLGRILYPYVIWSCVFYLVSALTAGGTAASPAGYVKHLIVGYPYHFVPLLIFWYLAAPLVTTVGRRHGVALLLAIGIWQALLVAVRMPDVSGVQVLPASWDPFLRVPVLFTPLSDWAIYFPLGLVLSLHDATVKPYLRRLRWPAVGLAAGLFLLGLLDALTPLTAPWARFAAPLPLMCLLPVITHASIPWVKRFEYLGKRSYGIYLVHFIAITLAAWMLADPQAKLGTWWLLAVIPGLLVVALAAPLLLMDLMTRTLPARRVFRYVFGIAPPADRHQASPSHAARAVPVAGTVRDGQPSHTLSPDTTTEGSTVHRVLVGEPHAVASRPWPLRRR